MQDIIQLIQKKLYTEAMNVCNEYLSSSPSDPTLYHLKGLIALRQNQYGRGIKYVQEAIELDPLCANYHSDLGVLYLKTQEVHLAKEQFLHSIELDDEHETALYNLASIYSMEDDHASALPIFKKLSSVHPDDEGSLFNYAYALNKCHKYRQALDAYKAVLNINAFNADAVNNIALIYLELQNIEKAHKYFHRAITVDPNFPDPFTGLGQINILEGHFTTAAEYLEEGIDIGGPSYKLYAKCLTLLAHCYQQLLDFENLNKTIRKLKSAINYAKNHDTDPFIDPFPALGLDISGHDMLDIANFRAKNIQNSVEVCPLWSAEKYNTKQDIIRIGYISPDFRTHSVGMLFRDIFLFHDRDKFHVTGFHLNSAYDSITNKIQHAMDEFYQVDHLSDFEIANIIAEHEIDILIDLGGYTKDTRPKIFAYAPAPIQCIHSLGYSFSMGASYISHYIADKQLVTNENKEYFVENIIYTENIISTTDFSDYPMPELKPKSEYGLPEDKFIFACFTMPYRLNQETLDLFCEILTNAPDSVLWLYSHNPQHEAAVTQYIFEAKICPTRVIFLTETKITTDFAIRHANLLLDPIGLSSCTSVLLGLHCGIVTLTLPLKLPQSRYTTAINSSCNLNEFIVKDKKEYINKALHCYNHPEQIHKIKDFILENNTKLPVFAAKVNTKNLEKNLIATYQDFVGLLTNKIEV